MKLAVGIVGPSYSVERIKYVGEKYYSEQLELISINYSKLEDIRDLIPAFQAKGIDFWLFSGVVPYSFAIENQLVDEEEAFYPALAGSGLYRTMIRILLEQKHCWNRISFDTLNQDDIENALEDAELQIDFQTLPYHYYTELDSVYQYHKNLFESGYVDLCLTCINQVHERLQLDGIPTHHLSPTQNVIKKLFPDLLKQAASMAFQRSQVSVVAVEVDSKEWVTLRRKQTYEIQRREQHLERYLVDFAEKAQGSSVRIGDGLYFVFVTRGELVELEKNQEIQMLSQQIKKITQFDTQIGIGNGYTINEAEQNARKALQYAQERDNSSVMKVLQDGTVIEALSSEGTIRFSTRHIIESLKNKVEWKDGTTIGLSTISKVFALCHHYKKNEITSLELSNWLHVTDRSARRILKDLLILELAQEVGVEQPSVRGRPRKIYKIYWRN